MTSDLGCPSNLTLNSFCSRTCLTHQVPRKIRHPVNELIDATNKLQVLCLGHFLFDEEKNEARRNEGECEDDADWRHQVWDRLGSRKESDYWPLFFKL